MKPKLALVTHTLGGGVWSMTAFLYEIIRNDGYFDPTVFVVATSFDDSASVRILSPGSWVRGVRRIEINADTVPYVHIGAFISEIETQRYKPRRILTGALNEFDLVHIVSGTPAWAGIASGIRPPVCLFAATLVAEERVSAILATTWLKKLWMRGMTSLNSSIESTVLRQMKWVFAESDYTLKMLSHYVPLDRLCLAPPGVDTSYFLPAQAYQSNGYILSVGRFLDPRKNVRLLIESYRKLRELAPHSPMLVLAGNGGISDKDSGYLKTSGLEPYVKVYSSVTREKLACLYRNASMFILSSNEEGLGIVILEAMASGLPVISTDCGGPTTAVVEGQTGFLVPVNDSKMLSVTMYRALVDPKLREQMARASRKLAEERFSLFSAGRVYLERYHQLLT